MTQTQTKTLGHLDKQTQPRPAEIKTHDKMKFKTLRKKFSVNVMFALKSWLDNILSTISVAVKSQS